MSSQVKWTFKVRSMPKIKLTFNKKKLFTSPDFWYRGCIRLFTSITFISIYIAIIVTWPHNIYRKLPMKYSMECSCCVYNIIAVGKYVWIGAVKRSHWCTSWWSVANFNEWNNNICFQMSRIASMRRTYSIVDPCMVDTLKGFMYI